MCLKVRNCLTWNNYNFSRPRDPLCIANSEIQHTKFFPHTAPMQPWYFHLTWITSPFGAFFRDKTHGSHTETSLGCMADGPKPSSTYSTVCPGQQGPHKDQCHCATLWHSTLACSLDINIKVLKGSMKQYPLNVRLGSQITELNDQQLVLLERNLRPNARIYLCHTVPVSSNILFHSLWSCTQSDVYLWLVKFTSTTMNGFHLTNI